MMSRSRSQRTKVTIVTGALMLHKTVVLFNIYIFCPNLICDNVITFTFSRRFYPKRLTNEDNESNQNQQKAVTSFS